MLEILDEFPKYPRGYLCVPMSFITHLIVQVLLSNTQLRGQADLYLLLLRRVLKDEHYEDFEEVLRQSLRIPRKGDTDHF